jgi:hypothetical protein
MQTVAESGNVYKKQTKYTEKLENNMLCGVVNVYYYHI